MSYQDEWEVEDIIEQPPSAKKTTVDASAIVEEEDEKPKESPKNKKRSKKEILKQRSEASLNISEFNLTEVGKEKVKLNELVKASLKSTGQDTQKSLQSVKKLKKLTAPLSKQHQEKIKRSIAYEKICDEVAKWDSLVQSNRSADQIVFPLKKPDFQVQALDRSAENFVTKHPVEIAVSELLDKSEHKLEPEKQLTVAEENALKAMSAAEAKRRHDELMRNRALISYREAKARYQNKIKSKKYHRLLKKEKLKKAVKEFEELQKNDASKALEKFAELDKLRILERMTLKHRNTGKWAKQHKIRAKYNPDSRSVLKEDLLVGRQLREKVELAENLSSNLETSERMDDVGLIEETNEDVDQTSLENVVDDALLEAYQNTFQEDAPKEQKKLKKDTIPKSTVSKKETVDDIMDFASREQCLESAVPDGMSFGDEGFDEVMEDVMPMSEAFGDEECIAEFKAEKEAADEANKPKGIDLFLPGWGSWGGPGIKQSNKKRNKFYIEPPAPAPKKSTLGNVILNEDRDQKAALHQVNTLPFPFVNVRQFESYIRQPIGHTWNPQSTFQNLIAPKVVTKMGKIIEPIDTEDLVLNTQKPVQKKLKKGKKKKGNEVIKAFLE